MQLGDQEITVKVRRSGSRSVLKGDPMGFADGSEGGMRGRKEMVQGSLVRTAAMSSRTLCHDGNVLEMCCPVWQLPSACDHEACEMWPV